MKKKLITLILTLLTIEPMVFASPDAYEGEDNYLRVNNGLLISTGLGFGHLKINREKTNNPVEEKFKEESLYSLDFIGKIGYGLTNQLSLYMAANIFGYKDSNDKIEYTSTYTAEANYYFEEYGAFYGIGGYGLAKNGKTYDVGIGYDVKDNMKMEVTYTKIDFDSKEKTNIVNINILYRLY